MASVTFPVGVGGDGSTVTDDANPTTGLANGGHRTRFVPALGQVVAVANNVVSNATAASASASAAASSAATAANSPGTSATSTTSLAVGTGSRTLTIQAGKLFVIGQFIVVANTPAPANYMAGQITAYDSGTGVMTVNVTSANGSGTLSAWTVSISGPPGEVSLSGAQTLTNKTIAFASNTLTGVASTSTAQTLTNKTIDFNSNTIQNLPASLPFSSSTALAQVHAISVSFF